VAEKSKYKTVSIPRGVTELIEELIEERGLWPSVSAFAREACLAKIEREQKTLQELRENEDVDEE